MGKATSSAAREAWSSIHRLFFDRSLHDRVHRVCDELKINPGLMKAMFQLDPDQPKSMRALAGEWHCDASYVTALVDGLEERGFVERQLSPDDRRVKLVVFTPEGRKGRERLFEVMHEPPTFFKALTAAEQRQLRDLLAKMVDAAIAEPDVSPPRATRA